MTTIEDLKPDEFERVASWLSRPEINRWLASEWRNRDISSVVVAMAIRNKRNRLFLVRHQGEPCGLVGLADIDPADRTAMMWCLLGEQKLAGRGVTTEALKKLARFAFTELALASVYSWVMEDNLASLRMTAKAGFREAGRIRQATSSSGRQVDRIYFDLVPEDLGL
jgi:RimJ/RimL family protein N-acetyltransferase